MLDATTRLAALISGEKRQHPKLNKLEILRSIDAQIVPLFMAIIENLPVSKQTLLGLVEITREIDNKVAEMGHDGLKTNPRIQTALKYFEAPETTLENVMAPNPTSGKPVVESFGDLRKSLWAQILPL